MYKLIALNFQVSVWLSIAGGVALINQSELILDHGEDMYGPLMTNLVMAVAYLTLMQLACWWVRYSGRLPGRAETLFMGFIFLGVSGGLSIYAEANQIPIADWLMQTCVYISASHLLYFWSESIKTAAMPAKSP